MIFSPNTRKDVEIEIAVYCCLLLSIAVGLVSCEKSEVIIGDEVERITEQDLDDILISLAKIIASLQDSYQINCFVSNSINEIRRDEQSILFLELKDKIVNGTNKRLGEIISEKSLEFGFSKDFFDEVVIEKIPNLAITLYRHENSFIGDCDSSMLILPVTSGFDGREDHFENAYSAQGEVVTSLSREIKHTVKDFPLGGDFVYYCDDADRVNNTQWGTTYSSGLIDFQVGEDL